MTHSSDVNETITWNAVDFPVEKLFLAGCVLAAFLLRLFLIPDNAVINGDGIYYTILGERLVSGDISGGISAYWSPVYSLLTGVASLLFEDRDFAGRAVSLAAGALLIIPAYLLFRDFFGQNAAYIGSILLVVNPALIDASGWVMTESLYSLVFVICLLSGWNALQTGELGRFFYTGLLLGVAFLVKPEAIGFVALMLVLIVCTAVFGSSRFSHSAVSYLVLLSGFLLLFAPYVVFLHFKTGQWTISQKISVNLPAADYEGDLLALSQSGKMTMKDRIWGDDYETGFYSNEMTSGSSSSSAERFTFGRIQSAASILGARALMLLKKQVRDYFPELLPYPFLLLAVAGFFGRPWTREFAGRQLYLLAFLLCTLIGYASSAVELRYLYPLIAILVAWAANGLAGFSEWASVSIGKIFDSRWNLKPEMIQAATMAVLLISLVPLFANTIRADGVQNVPLEEKRAGQWIAENTAKPSPLILSTNITPAYYAGADHLYMPEEDLSTIISYARLRNVDYLIFSDRRVKEREVPIPDIAQMPSELVLVHHDAENPEFRIYVYKVSQ